jgi:CRISPR-associated protein (TIGR03984 family)
MQINMRNYYTLNGQVTLNEINNIINLFELDNLFVLMIEDHEVNVGIYKNKRLIFSKDKSLKKFLQELRLFNESIELKFIRISDDKYYYRLITNEEANKSQIIMYDTYEEKYMLNGSRVINHVENQGITFSSLTEDSGLFLTIPFKLDKGNLRIYVNVINYINYSNEGLMEFVDSRLEGFYLNKNQKLRVGE